MAGTRKRQVEQIEKAAQAVVEFHLLEDDPEGNGKKGWTAREVRTALGGQHPCIRLPDENDECAKDAQIAIWRRVLRRAEELAFADGWYLTQVPGGKIDDRVLTQDPRRIGQSINGLLDHAKTRVYTAGQYLKKVGDHIDVLPESVRGSYVSAVKVLEGAEESIVLIQRALYDDTQVR